MTRHLILAKLRSFDISVVNGAGSCYGSGCRNRSGDGDGYGYVYGDGFGNGYGNGSDNIYGFGTGLSSGHLTTNLLIFEKSEQS
jgi:hypothetical protein